MRSWSDLIQCRHMLSRSITLVALPGKLRVTQGESLHEPIPHHLGKDRCRSYGERASVPVNHRFVIAAQFVERRTIKKYMLRRNSQTCERATHRQRGCPPDVEPVDLPHRSRRHRPRQRLPLNDNGGRFPLGRRQQFRIRHPGETRTFGGEYHRRREHGTRQRAPACLINSRDKPTPLRPQLPFPAERGASHLTARASPGCAPPCPTGCGDSTASRDVPGPAGQPRSPQSREHGAGRSAPHQPPPTPCEP